MPDRRARCSAPRSSAARAEVTLGPPLRVARGSARRRPPRSSSSGRQRFARADRDGLAAPRRAAVARARRRVRRARRRSGPAPGGPACRGWSRSRPRATPTRSSRSAPRSAPRRSTSMSSTGAPAIRGVARRPGIERRGRPRAAGDSHHRGAAIAASSRSTSPRALARGRSTCAPPPRRRPRRARRRPRPIASASKRAPRSSPASTASAPRSSPPCASAGRRGRGSCLHAALAGFGSRPTLTAPAGSARVAQQFGLLGLSTGAPSMQRIRLYAALAAGVLHTAIDGQADAPAEAHAVDRWSFLLDGSVGARVRLPGQTFFTLALHAQVAAPYVAIHFADTLVATHRASQSAPHAHPRCLAVTASLRAARSSCWASWPIWSARAAAARAPTSTPSRAERQLTAGAPTASRP